ncbi:hypothetical protein RB213_005193, partial [Colletotrichum asianum]
MIVVNLSLDGVPCQPSAGEKRTWVVILASLSSPATWSESKTEMDSGLACLMATCCKLQVRTTTTLALCMRRV